MSAANDGAHRHGWRPIWAFASVALGIGSLTWWHGDGATMMNLSLLHPFLSIAGIFAGLKALKLRLFRPLAVIGILLSSLNFFLVVLGIWAIGQMTH